MKRKVGRMAAGRRERREKTREEVWKFLRSYMTGSQGRPPSTREIQVGAKLRSLSNVHRTLGELEKSGLIRCEGFGKARSIRIVGAGYLLPDEPAENERGNQ